MIKKLFSTTLLLLSLDAFAEFKLWARGTSDYLWRGLTQTSNDPAAQAGFDLKTDGLSIGSWATNVEEDFQINAFANYSFNFSKSFSTTFGFHFYHYPTSGAHDTGEFNIKLSLFEVELLIAYIDEYFDKAPGGSTSYRLSRTINFNGSDLEDFGLLLEAGYTNFEDEEIIGSEDYFDYQVAILKSFGHLESSLHYSDTNRKYDSTKSGAPDDRSIFFMLTLSN